MNWFNKIKQIIVGEPTPIRPESPTILDQQDDYTKYTPQQIFENWEDIEKKAPAFIRRFVKNIDDKTRLAYWMTMVHPEQYTYKNPDLFNTLCCTAEKRCIENEEFKSICDKIDLDVSRTLVDDKDMNDDKRLDLRDILRTFAVLIPRTGYCQGMSFLAGQILLITNHVEDTLWIFTYFMKDLNLYGLFCDGIPLLKFSIFCIEYVINKKCPAITQYLNKENTSLLIICNQWLTALFSINFNKDVTLKIWDMFLLEGFVYLIKISCALLLIHQNVFTGPLDICIKNIRNATLNDTWKMICDSADGVVFSEKELKECKTTYDQMNHQPNL